MGGVNNRQEISGQAYMEFWVYCCWQWWFLAFHFLCSDQEKETQRCHTQL